VANNLGQAVISEFFVVPVTMDGALSDQPVPLRKFVEDYSIDRPLQTQAVDEDTLVNL